MIAKPDRHSSRNTGCNATLPPSTPPGSVISWLLGTAVRLEFAEKPDKFNKKQKVEDLNGKAGEGFSGPEFEAEVASLAELFKVLALMIESTV